MPESITNYDDRFQAASVFFAEMIKGNATARWALSATDFDWNRPCKIGGKLHDGPIKLLINHAEGSFHQIESPTDRSSMYGTICIERETHSSFSINLLWLAKS